MNPKIWQDDAEARWYSGERLFGFTQWDGKSAEDVDPTATCSAWYLHRDFYMGAQWQESDNYLAQGVRLAASKSGHAMDTTIQNKGLGCCAPCVAANLFRAKVEGSCAGGMSCLGGVCVPSGRVGKFLRQVGLVCAGAISCLGRVSVPSGRVGKFLRQVGVVVGS